MEDFKLTCAIQFKKDIKISVAEHLKSKAMHRRKSIVWKIMLIYKRMSKQIKYIALGIRNSESIKKVIGRNNKYWRGCGEIGTLVQNG